MLIFDNSRTGPGRKFCDADAMYILNALCDKQYLGRAQICRMLGLGAHSVRGLVMQMESDGMVETSRRGVRITAFGRELLMHIPAKPVEIGPDPKFVLGEFTQAVKVPGMGDQVLNGLRQVRTATMMGATGCTTYIVMNGALMLPPHMLPMADYGAEFLEIKNDAELDEGDVLLVCGADTKRKAMVSAMYVALDFY